MRYKSIKVLKLRALSNSTLPLTPTPPDSIPLWRQSTKKGELLVRLSRYGKEAVRVVIIVVIGR